MSRLILGAVSVLVWGSHALAFDSDQERLRFKVEKYQKRSAEVGAANAPDWRALVTRLTTQAPPTTTGCVEASRQVVAGAYVLTTDAQRKPCRLYDLTFPTAQSWSGPVKVGRLPLQTFGARDYLAWVEGDYEKVLRRMSDFRAVDTSSLPVAGWVRDLRFKKTSAARVRVANRSLPRQFTAADLDLGAKFDWTATDRQILNQLAQGLPALSSQTEAWRRVLDNPENLLAHISFDWNDVEKVYEIALDGQFLPLAGPIVLVDFERSYRLAVETLLRSVMHSALNEVLKVIPMPARNLLSIAIDDGFEFVEMAYAYQENRLEATLKHQEQLDQVVTERGLNILAGGRADFVSQYLKAIITKQPFDWNMFEDLGRTMRYDVERRRDVSMSRLNSSMVLDQGCTTTFAYDYFAFCAKGTTRQLHTMISDLSILFWNLGAPLIYDPQTPSNVSLRRGAAYLLSVGSRLVQLPYLSGLMGQLTSICKQFAFAGVVDEGLLRGSLHAQQRAGLATSFDEELSGWLYLQNLNVFLPKSKIQEAAIIEANAARLGLRKGDL